MDYLAIGHTLKDYIEVRTSNISVELNHSLVDSIGRLRDL